MAVEARRSVEPVSLIGPPPVDAELHRRLVRGPVARHLAIRRPVPVARASARQRWRRARVAHASGEGVPLDHHVEHDLEVLRMKLLDHRSGVGEVRGVPGELAVVRVPPGRAEIGAEVDERVAWEPLLAHRPRHRHHLLAPGERAVRLLVSQRPSRRQLREPGDSRVFAHDRCGIARRDHEDVERERSAIRGREHAAVAGEVERAVRLMDEQRPPAGADEPLDRRTRAVRRQLVSALAVDHRVLRSAAVELRPALSHAEYRPVAERETHLRRLGVEPERLHERAAPVEHANGRGPVGDLDGQIAGAHSPW